MNDKPKYIGQGYAQGDILFMPVNKIPENCREFPRENGKLVIALGEVTGHHHRIEEPTTKGWVDEEDQVWVQVNDLINDVNLVHEEHGQITLPPGNYRVINVQREFQSEKGEIRRVVD